MSEQKPPLYLGLQEPTFDKPSAGRHLRAVYENAIEFSIKQVFERFYFVGMAVTLTPMSLAIIAIYGWVLTEELHLLRQTGATFVMSEIDYILPGIALLLGWGGIGHGWAAFKIQVEESALFNRETQTVSFAAHPLPRRGSGAPQFAVKTYAWSRVRGRLEQITSRHGGSLNLVLDLLDEHDDTQVVDSYRLGVTSSFGDHAQALWEHLRRYMNENGPSLQAGDRVWEGETRDPWRAFRQALLPPHRPVQRVLRMILFPVSVPCAACLALGIWAGKRFEWPDDILRAAGHGPLDEAELHSWLERERTVSRISAERPDPS